MSVKKISKNFVCIMLLIISFNVNAKCNIEFDNSDICATLKFKSKISRKKENRFEIIFYNTKSKQVVTFSDPPKVYLWMVMKNGHEHGSEKLELSMVNNSYLYSNAYFMMLGQWYIKVELPRQSIKSSLAVCLKRGKNMSHIGKCE